MEKSLDKLLLEEEVSLKRYSTFQIGGRARFFLIAKSVESIQEGILWARSKGIPFFILGKGSNCLFSDKGYEGLVILNKVDFLEQQGPSFKVGAGHSFSHLGTISSKMGYSGLEFAAGIPASVGGAVFMNAGANGAETFDSLQSVDFVDESGHLVHFEKKDLQFSYRFSSFQKLKGSVVSATFLLTESRDSRKKQLEIISNRKDSQPLKDPSAGCIFKNPSLKSAGFLIEDTGLKGKCFGGAKVSTLHANFIINKGEATAEDVKALAKHVQEEVKQKHNIQLQSEVYFINENGERMKVCE
ncbi:UDP-N-acetylenolpyruvoylglucosamine reductase [Chlamydiales bacterium SCGC AB-751-O23]|jgi:UDP-N-acetylmuramate dehydrogenase|nr:UDP-N-acetylenolpyruvoylglucosamine reductase [Chlamydiales bacterium SCGC AB-751-O23]